MTGVPDICITGTADALGCSLAPRGDLLRMVPVLWRGYPTGSIADPALGAATDPPRISG
eukprot:CAMPEP_0114681414 /NCGR_PEP_ID=MMETSP0191-20121206/55347_1 /TAXON_ID=126664 /ORGANISM="Sorites sp." /LENGTH=58 /DNA_ID=CAMNT_0001959659 /DNA_START=95 /DNA_END=271 /DNA_ORIENTATION=+